MKTQEELREKLERAYNTVREQRAEITSWNKFANFIGIPYITIFRLLKGKSNITITTLRRIYTELAVRDIVIEDDDIIPIQRIEDTESKALQTTIENITHIYNLLRVKKIVKSQRDFATFIGVNDQVLSAALRGDERYLTVAFIRKMNEAIKPYGLNVYTPTENVDKPVDNNEQINRLIALLYEKDKQIDRLLSIIEKLNK